MNNNNSNNNIWRKHSFGFVDSIVDSIPFLIYSSWSFHSFRPNDDIREKPWSQKLNFSRYTEASYLSNHQISKS